MRKVLADLMAEPVNLLDGPRRISNPRLAGVLLNANPSGREYVTLCGG
jgi:hypothetical protein